MILQHHKGYLQPEDIKEIGRLFEQCPKSHNSYQNYDTSLVEALLASPLFGKLKPLLRDHFICEAWFIIGEKYTWHSDAHVDLFSDTVFNLWIPYEMSAEPDVPVMEYYDEDRKAPKRVRDARTLVRFLISARSWASRLPASMALTARTERLFGRLAGGTPRSIKGVEVGDILVLDPSYLHRSGPRRKKVLAIQCVPEAVVKDPRKYYSHTPHTSRAARKALAAIALQAPRSSME